MKYLAKSFSLLLFLFLFSAAHVAQAKLDVFACEPEWGALVQELGGDNIDVYTATTAMQDPHTIQARPALIAKIRKADLLVCTGSELEIGWLPVLLRRSGNARVQEGAAGYFMASEHVTLLDIPQDVDRSHGDVHPGGNPHIQTDPRNIAAIAKPLAHKLAELDQANAHNYAAQHTDFNRRWQAAITRWQQRALPLKGVNVVVHHTSWRYLFNWLHITEVASLEPKPGVPASAGHLANVLSQLQKTPAKMVIRTPYQDTRASTWLAEKAKLNEIVLPFTVGGNEHSNDLFALFDSTISQLIAANQ